MDATGEGGGRGREGGREEGVECQMKRQHIYKKRDAGRENEVAEAWSLSDGEKMLLTGYRGGSTQGLAVIIRGPTFTLP